MPDLDARSQKEEEIKARIDFDMLEPATRKQVNKIIEVCADLHIEGPPVLAWKLQEAIVKLYSTP